MNLFPKAGFWLPGATLCSRKTKNRNQNCVPSGFLTFKWNPARLAKISKKALVCLVCAYVNAPALGSLKQHNLNGLSLHGSEKQLDGRCQSVLLFTSTLCFLETLQTLRGDIALPPHVQQPNQSHILFLSTEVLTLKMPYWRGDRVHSKRMESQMAGVDHSRSICLHHLWTF